MCCARVSTTRHSRSSTHASPTTSPSSCWNRSPSRPGAFSCPPPTFGDARVPVALLESAALLFGGRPMGVRQRLDDVDGAQSTSPGERLVADLLRAYLELAEGSRDEATSAAERVLGEMDAIDDT